MFQCLFPWTQICCICVVFIDLSTWTPAELQSCFPKLDNVDAFLLKPAITATENLVCAQHITADYTVCSTCITVEHCSCCASCTTDSWAVISRLWKQLLWAGREHSDTLLFHQLMMRRAETIPHCPPLLITVCLSVYESATTQSHSLSQTEICRIWSAAVTGSPDPGLF